MRPSWKSVAWPIALFLVATASRDATAAAAASGYPKTAGTQIVGPDGSPLRLRGIHLGGWVPFHYGLVYDSDSRTFLEPGFDLLSALVGWCKKYGIYLILDMHCAPGGQNAGNISDSDGSVARLCTDVSNQDQTVAIRTADGNQILFVEGNPWATDFTGFTPPFDSNMVYSLHKYWNATTQDTIQGDLSLRDAAGAPLWLGKFGENSTAWGYDVIQLAERHWMVLVDSEEAGYHFGAAVGPHLRGVSEGTRLLEWRRRPAVRRRRA